MYKVSMRLLKYKTVTLGDKILAYIWVDGEIIGSYEASMDKHHQTEWVQQTFINKLQSFTQCNTQHSFSGHPE